MSNQFKSIRTQLNKKSMRLLHLCLFLLALLTFSDESFSLTDYQIKKICKKEERELTCIRNLQEKRSNLHKGNKIEIPIIPFKK